MIEITQQSLKIVVHCAIIKHSFTYLQVARCIDRLSLISLGSLPIFGFSLSAFADLE